MGLPVFEVDFWCLKSSLQELALKIFCNLKLWRWFWFLLGRDIVTYCYVMGTIRIVGGGGGMALKFGPVRWKVSLAKASREKEFFLFVQ